MRAQEEHDQLRAVTEVTLLSGAYILISTWVARAADLTFVFPLTWSSAERATGSGFLSGAIVQVALVLLGAYLLRRRDLRAAIRASLRPSTREAWTIAAVATAIHIGTAVSVFIPEPSRYAVIGNLEHGVLKVDDLASHVDRDNLPVPTGDELRANGKAGEHYA